MATYTKKLLSASTSGKGIAVTDDSSADAVVIHTAVAGAAAWDEIWLYAVNISATGSKLTLEWGTSTAEADNIELTIPAESGLVLVIPGLLLNGGLDVQAFAATDDVITIHGYVNAITDA